MHPAGECNRTVYSKLRKHRAVSSDEDEEEGEAADEDNYPDDDDDDTQANDPPRWDTLKGLNLDEN